MSVLSPLPGTASAPPPAGPFRASRFPRGDDAFDELAAGGILEAVAASDRLRRLAATDHRLAGDLVLLLDRGDDLARMLALYALSAAPGNDIDRTVVAALGDPALAEHGAWALSGRAPVASAIPGLVRLIAAGGFAAMPAQLALERWGGSPAEAADIRHAVARAARDQGWSSRLVETLALLGSAASPARRAPEPPRRARRRGLRIAQILLRGSVDADLEVAGSGDGGGVVTLLVQLARELGCLERIDESVIIARPRDTEDTEAPTGEPIGPGARILRLPFGPDEDVPVAAMWEHRVQVEHALEALLVASGPIDVAHLRYADAGTFAAARALRRAGVKTVFTLAPDPHALIVSRELGGDLTRQSFAEAEPGQHNLFRLRLVDELTGSADGLVALPRTGGLHALERLVGRPLDSRRTTVIPEGIATDPLDRALGQGPADSRAVADLGAALEARDRSRLNLPLIVSAGRFHPVKGFPRLVEAWGGDPKLAGRFNLVIVGGARGRPSADEQAVAAEIEAVAAREPAARAGLVLLGPRPHEDVIHLLAAARHGLDGVVAPGGLYACASAKEEFGVALLEAMGTGLPVVAPDAGGPATYVEEGVTGALVRADDVDALRRGLRRATLLARDGRCAAEAMAVVRERFAIGPTAALLTDAYSRAAGAR